MTASGWRERVGERLRTLPFAAPRGRAAHRALLVIEVALLALAIVAARSMVVATTRLPNGDVTEYHTYALQFWLGHPMLASLPVEYPPLAVLPFSLTLLPPLADFQSVFAWWASAAVIAGYLGYLRFADRRRALAYFIYLIVGAAGVIVARFDIFPALATLVALWAAQRRHFATAYLLLAVGVLLKLYPIFLAPLVVLAQWQALTRTDAVTAVATLWRERRTEAGRRLRRALGRVAEGVALFVGTTALGFALAFLLDPSGALTEFTYAGSRPLQVESTPATLLWLGSVVGIPAHAEFSYLSLNFVGPLDIVLKPLSTVALALGCLCVYWRFARGRMTLAQAFLACLAVIIAANKIFSPQYMIWITPFVAEVYGLDALWLIICALTTLIFPYLYGIRNPIQTVTYDLAFLPAVAIRNLFLLWATVRAILETARSHQTTAQASAIHSPPDAQTESAPARPEQPRGEMATSERG